MPTRNSSVGLVNDEKNWVKSSEMRVALHFVHKVFSPLAVELISFLSSSIDREVISSAAPERAEFGTHVGQ